MTTSEEYAEAAELCADEAMVARHMSVEGSNEHAAEFAHEADIWGLAARVLRALANGAVLCRPTSVQGEEVDQITAWYPIEEQP